MIPLRDIIPSRTTPYVTVTVIVMNAVAWLYEVTLPEQTLHTFLLTYGVVPGALEASTLVSSMFLHGSWAHVIGNMWYLWIFGDNVEDRMGHGRFIAFYLLCGIGAAIGHVMAEPGSMIPTVGASGAIAGVMGAYFVLYPHSKVLTLIPLIIVWDVVELPAILLLGFWFLLQLLSAGASTLASDAGGGGIAFVAHVAGFALGAIGVYVFKKRQPPVEWLY
ncbi:MAG: rhomboid family intramembrane serine protease [Vicinamibacterales bacterium]